MTNINRDSAQCSTTKCVGMIANSQQKLHDLFEKITCDNWKTKRVDDNFSKLFGGPEKGRLF